MLDKRIGYLLLLLFVAKCVLAAFVPLVADEAYYYVWSLRPQLSYYDHPAMVSWLIYVSHSLIGFKSPLAVRLLFVILGTATLYVWLLIIKKNLISNKAMWVFIALYLLNPMLGLGSIIATPDVPLVFFWSLSYLFFLNLLEDKKMKWYVLLGISLGLGFCSKYLIVLFVMAGLVALIFSKKYKLLSVKGVGLTVVAGFIFSLPVLIWNYNNEWVSFLFQINHGFGRSYYKPEWTYGYLIGQFLLVSPLIFIQLFTRSSNSFLSSQLPSSPSLFDRWFSLTQISFFITSTFKSVVEANWAITSYAHAISFFTQKAGSKVVRATFYYWAIIYTILVVMLFTPAGLKALKNQPTSTDVVALRSIVEKYQPLYGPSYQVAALISWDQQKLIPKLAGLSRKDFFDHLPESTPTAKTIYVLKHIDSVWPATAQKAIINKLDEIPSLQLQLFQVNYE